MNQTLQAITARYSCREFAEPMPTEAHLQAIAQAAVSAPSGMNRQPWRIIVVKNRALIAEMDAEGMRMLAAQEDKSAYERMMARGGTLFYHAPCMFLIAMEPDTGLDCGIVSQNIALAATSLGLGSVICGMARIPFLSPRGAEFKRKLGIPDGFEFGMAVLVGTPKGEGKPPHQPDLSKVSWIG